MEMWSERREEVKQNWEKSWAEEGNKSILAELEKFTPIIKAYRIQEKSGIGFEFASAEDAWKK